MLDASRRSPATGSRSLVRIAATASLAVVAALLTGGPVAAEGASGPRSVTAAAAPTISSVAPRVGLPGQRVTIRGTGFGDAEADNVVTFGRARARVLVADPTELTVVVPDLGRTRFTGAHASSKIRVRTAGGVTRRTADFFVPPYPGQSVSDVVSTGRIHMGGPPRTVTVGRLPSVAVVLVDAQAGQHLSIDFTDVTVPSGRSPNGRVEVVPPHHDAFSFAGTLESSSAMHDLDANSLALTAPTTGTYTIVVYSELGPGRATIRAAFPPFGQRPFAGEPTEICVVTPRRNVVRYFEATAGTRLGIGVTDSTLWPVRILVTGPDHQAIGMPFATTGDSFLYEVGDPLPVTGRYRIVIDPHRQATGCLTLFLEDLGR